jgi:hypothetical protein
MYSRRQRNIIGLNGKPSIGQGGDGPYVPPASQLIDALDSMTDAGGNTRVIQGAASSVGSLDTTSNIEGAAGININQTTPTNATIGVNTANAGSQDVGTFGAIALYFDCKNDTSALSLSGASLGLTRGAASTTVTKTFSPAAGGQWLLFHQSDFTALVTAGLGTLAHSERMTQFSPYGAMGTFDALIKNAGGMPTYCMTVDDIFDTHYNTWFPLMQARGLVGTLFLPPNFIGQANRMTLAQLQEMHNAGWGIGNDLTPDDTSVSTDPTTAVAACQGIRDFIHANGLAVTSDNSRHGCFPNGVAPLATSQALYDSGMRTLRTVQAGYLYTKHGIAKGDARQHPSNGSTSSLTSSQLIAILQRGLDLGATTFTHWHDMKASPSAIGIQTQVAIDAMDWLQAKKAAGLAAVIRPDQLYARDGVCAKPIVIGP